LPTLLTVNGNRIDLEPNRSYVLGRSNDCDITVGDVACSRRHARLTVGGEARRVLFIEDMGSRNGTYVNDQRIWDRTAIKDGCLIRIGATVYLLAMEHEEGDEALIDTGTVAIEKFSFGTDIDTDMLRVLRRDGPSPTNFAGKLETLNLIDVLQLLIYNQRSGCLNVKLRDGTGTVEVRAGDVLTAEYCDLEGFDALVAMARQNAGTFWLVERSRDCPRTIREQSSHLLVELCKALDEKSPV